MFRNNVCCTELDKYPVNEIGRPVDEIVVDQFYSQDFNLGENGFARSDIQALIHAESDDLKMQIASRIVEVKAKYADSKLTDEQIAKLAIPRYVQSDHDFREWSASLGELGLEKSLVEQIKKVNEQSKDSPDVIQFDKNDSETKDV